jgi:hypothetical protein
VKYTDMGRESVNPTLHIYTPQTAVSQGLCRTQDGADLMFLVYYSQSTQESVIVVAQQVVHQQQMDMDFTYAAGSNLIVTERDAQITSPVAKQDITTAAGKLGLQVGELSNMSAGPSPLTRAPSATTPSPTGTAALNELADLGQGVSVAVTQITGQGRVSGETRNVAVELRLINQSTTTTFPRFTVVCPTNPNPGLEGTYDNLSVFHPPNDRFASLATMPTGTSFGSLQLRLPEDPIVLLGSDYIAPPCSFPAVLRIYLPGGANVIDVAIPDDVIRAINNNPNRATTTQ